MPENVGNRIRAARIARNMTQEELAKRIGTTKQNIYKYENGIITNIPLENVEAISDALGVDPGQLLGWGKTRDVNRSDLDRLEAMHQNPRLGLLFDRQRGMSDEDIEFMIQMAGRIIKERDGE